VRYQRSAADIAEQLQKQFGYVVVATDDALEIGEHIPNLETTRGLAAPRAQSEVQAVVIDETTYPDYRKQAEASGFGDTCTDCCKHYFKIELKATALSPISDIAGDSKPITENFSGGS
jgi:hypothetical protein